MFPAGDTLDIQAQFEAFMATYRQSMFIALGVALGIYLAILILGGIGMHVMAKKRGMKGSWMAFVPFLNTLYAGKLAGEVNVFGKKSQVDGNRSNASGGRFCRLEGFGYRDPFQLYASRVL